jgi:hypothetical protein
MQQTRAETQQPMRGCSRWSYLRVFRGLSKTNLPGDLGSFQFLRTFRQLTACEQAELIVHTA